MRILVVLFALYLAGIAWVVSIFGGYPFWRTLLVVVGGYAAVLLTHIAYEVLRGSFYKR
jgi:hypothetical protein